MYTDHSHYHPAYHLQRTYSRCKTGTRKWTAVAHHSLYRRITVLDSSVDAQFPCFRAIGGCWAAS